MGRFVDPENSAFQVALNSEIYVDKTGLLGYTNKVLGTKQAMICNSRPRRFGKSVTADMLAAYYSRGCDSEQIFEGLTISRDEKFREHLNRYHVVYFDVQWCCMDAGSAEKTVDYINSHILKELKELYPEAVPDTVKTAYGAMSCINAAVKEKFIVVIDEWDVLIRDEAANEAVQEEYINFLRGMFKGSEPTKYLLMAYLTGILPIKKVRTQSALNNFDEFTMLSAGVFAPYIGFTENEVRSLCERYGRNFEEVKRWYDGYLLAGWQVYNPKAVVSVMMQGDFQSYWSQTGTYEMILSLINMNFDGLRTNVIEMISGASVDVNVSSFRNDMVSFADKDDVLTLLIHMGYLAYDQRNQKVFIPNEEIRQEFAMATRKNRWNDLMKFQQESAALLEATLDMDAEAVAEGMEKIHTEYASAIQYNNENSLSSVITIGYLGAMQYYFKPVREMPAGKGFADFVYLPKKEYTSEYPAMVIELKWNKNADAAIRQIKERKYAEALHCYTGEILLVGINYDRKSKKHECMMEKIIKE